MLIDANWFTYDFVVESEDVSLSMNIFKDFVR